MELVVGTLSTWSLRAIICAEIANIPLKLTAINLEKSGYKAEVLKYSPSGLVPALLVEGEVVHDSLAIVEYFNELAPNTLYPENALERAKARSLCMELHSGFMNLRRECPFSFVKVSPLENASDSVKKELDRIETIFAQAKGPFMFDQASVVDAFYVILAYRLQSYGIVFSGKAGEYQRSLLDWSVLNTVLNKAQTWS